MTKSDILRTWAPMRRFAWRVGRRLYCEARGDVGNAIATNGERYVQSCVLHGTRAVLGPLIVLDIGACIGDWTRTMLDALPQDRLEATRIFAFEPSPALESRLRQSLASLPRANIVTLLRLAMSNQRGAAKIAVLSETGGTNTLEFDAAITSVAREIVSVETETLDGFCETHGVDRIHIVKCDTEGHDMRVMEGALPLLRAERIDVFQFEYNHRWVYARAFLKDTFDLVSGMPYSVARVCSRHIEVLEEWHPELERFFEGNYLLVRKPALDWFDVVHGHFDVSNTYA